jgi:hypothetical protein
MAYIFAFIVIGLLITMLHYFTELTKWEKMSVAAVLVFIVSSAIAYNSYSNAQTQKMLHAVTKFNQNKTIHCVDVDVNSTNFTLSIGTYTFIGKKNTPYFGQMVSASQCR